MIDITGAVLNTASAWVTGGSQLVGNTDGNPRLPTLDCLSTAFHSPCQSCWVEQFVVYSMCTCFPSTCLYTPQPYSHMFPIAHIKNKVLLLYLAGLTKNNRKLRSWLQSVFKKQSHTWHCDWEVSLNRKHLISELNRLQRRQQTSTVRFQQVSHKTLQLPIAWDTLQQISRIGSSLWVARDRA